MKLPDCVWFVSGFRQPWEAGVIASLAEAVRSKGAFSLSVYAIGGTARLSFDGIMSWNSLTFLERARVVLLRGKLWHLWGEAPFWWGLVRLRARTVHTSLSERPRWLGQPTRFFKEQADDGENVILPTFEPKASWTETWPDSEPDGTVLLAWNESHGEREKIIDAWSEVSKKEDGRFKSAKIFVTSGEPVNMFQAAYMTMRGVPVIARDAPLVREMFGPDGYVAAPRAGDRQGWENALQTAAEAGRSISAAARRFLKDNYGAAAAAESLESLYEAVSRGKV